MSETPEEKTKRRFCDYMELADWKYQYSFFHNDLEVAQLSAIQDGAIIRKVLSRNFKTQPFLYRLCLTSRGYRQARELVDEETGEIFSLPAEKPALLPFHMFLTTEKLDYGLVCSLIGKYCIDSEVGILYRVRSKGQMIRYKSAVKIQKPHNLKRFFGDGKINRIALLNRRALSV